MHVLTKIFIVLVSLLAVLLVPLVVVYATNENNYRSLYQGAESQKAAVQEKMKVADARATSDAMEFSKQIADLSKANTELQTTKAAADATNRQLESQLASARGTQAAMTGDIAMIKHSIDAGQQLTESLINELRTLRADAVAIERQKVELDEALRDVTSQFEVAEQARRALAEELTRVKDEHSKALTKLGEFYARYGDREDVRIGDRGIRPGKSLTTNVVRVERSSGQVLAEIDAGARDGVMEGWNMAIGSGGTFIATLRIINVDINRATGIVTGESKERGLVQVGHTAHAVAGQN